MKTVDTRRWRHFCLYKEGISLSLCVREKDQWINIIFDLYPSICSLADFLWNYSFWEHISQYFQLLINSVTERTDHMPELDSVIQCYVTDGCMNRRAACVCSLRSALWTAPGCSGGRCVTSVASFNTAPCTSPLSPSPPSRWTADRFVWDRALPLFPLRGCDTTWLCDVLNKRLWGRDVNECLTEYDLSLMASFRHINKQNIRGAPAARWVEIAPQTPSNVPQPKHSSMHSVDIQHFSHDWYRKCR